jgi:hypothetical protein
MWFIIDDIEGFVESTRVLVYNMFGEEEKNIDDIDLEISNLDSESLTEINRCLTQEESKSIVMDYVKKSKTNEHYTISTDRYMKFIESLNSRLVSNILSKLSSDGHLESAFDEESNDFIFWTKSDEQDKNNTEN